MKKDCKITSILDSRGLYKDQPLKNSNKLKINYNK